MNNRIGQNRSAQPFVIKESHIFNFYVCPLYPLQSKSLNTIFGAIFLTKKKSYKTLLDIFLSKNHSTKPSQLNINATKKDII